MKQWRTVLEKQRIEYVEKSLSVCVCSFPFGFEGGLGFDCISMVNAYLLTLKI